MHKFRLSLFLLLLFAAGCSDPERTANGLYVEAAKSMQEAGPAGSPVDRLRLLARAQDNIEVILRDYATTAAAVRIASGERIGRWSHSELAAEIAKLRKEPAVCFSAPTKECLVAVLAGQVGKAMERQVREPAPNDPLGGLIALQFLVAMDAPEASALSEALLRSFSPQKLSLAQQRAALQEIMSLTNGEVIAALIHAKGLEAGLGKVEQAPPRARANLSGSTFASALAERYGADRLPDAIDVFMAVQSRVGTRDLTSALEAFISRTDLIGEAGFAKLLSVWPRDKLSTFADKLAGVSRLQPDVEQKILAYISRIYEVADEASRHAIADRLVSSEMTLPPRVYSQLFLNSSSADNRESLFFAFLKAARLGYGEDSKQFAALLSGPPGQPTAADIETNADRKALVGSISRGALQKEADRWISERIEQQPEARRALRNCRDMAAALGELAGAPTKKLIEACAIAINSALRRNFSPDEVNRAAYYLVSTTAKGDRQNIEDLLSLLDDAAFVDAPVFSLYERMLDFDMGREAQKFANGKDYTRMPTRSFREAKRIERLLEKEPDAAWAAIARVDSLVHSDLAAILYRKAAAGGEADGARFRLVASKAPEVLLADIGSALLFDGPYPADVTEILLNYCRKTPQGKCWSLYDGIVEERLRYAYRQGKTADLVAMAALLHQENKDQFESGAIILAGNAALLMP